MAPDSPGQQPTRPVLADPWDVPQPPAGKDPTEFGGGHEWDVSQVNRWAERLVGELGAKQRALVSYQQLVALGIGRGAIEHALASGRLHALHRGIYALIDPAALPPLAHQQAAVLACQPAAFLSHHWAAAVWRLRPDAVGEIEVTVAGRDAGRRREGIRVHRVRSLDRWDTRVYQGIPITSPARTLLDIASDVSPRELEWAFDEAAFVRELMTIRDARLTLARYPRRRGAARLRELAVPGRSSTATRSGGEELMFSLVRKGGLPEPEVNVKLGRYTADFFWRRERVVVEVDGYGAHRGRSAFERDHRRDGEHQDAGLLVIRITMRQLQNEPELFLVRLARELDRRAPR